jgi:hypothetical protein
MYKRLLELLKLVKPRQPHLPQNNVRRSVSRCEKCGSKNVGNTYSGYTRGYNELCQEACGDIGAFCNDCCHITFVQSLEDYKKSLPNWCRAYGY